MLIKLETPVSLKIEKLTDLPKLRDFMQDNNLKINKSAIARELDVDRRTVDKYLDGFKKQEHRNKPSKVDEFRDTITELLSSQTQHFYYRSDLYRYLTDNHNMNIPAQTFYHYIKSVPEFNSYFRSSNTDGASEVVIRYETRPGEQGQIDWKESVPFILSDTGELVHINVLVLILGHSRMRMYRPSLYMTQDALFHLLNEMFEAFGGVPKVLLTDNMKTVMDVARTEYSEGKINSRFDAFAKDYGFKVVPCKSATPKTKGKVESQMKYLEEIRAYSGKLDLVGLYELIERINNRINNTICQGTGKIPIMEFEKEKDSLLPLPPESVRNQYRIRTTSVKVNAAGMINVKSNQYSVPRDYIGKEVDYQIHDSTIYIYSNTKLIAVHTVSERKLNFTLEHYSESLAAAGMHKTADEVMEMAKQNLETIGGIYE